MYNAFQLYKHAAEEHHDAEIYNRLASCYNDGFGTQENHILAAAQYAKAAKLGSPSAHTRIGVLFEASAIKDVSSGKTGFEHALQWYVKAARLGDETAKQRLFFHKFLLESACSASPSNTFEFNIIENNLDVQNEEKSADSSSNAENNLKILGKGGYGIVYQASWSYSLYDKEKKKDVAVKTCSTINYLLTKDQVVKLTDFGIAMLPECKEKLFEGTTGYLPPEKIREDNNLTTAVDIFALGIVLWEIGTGKKPPRTPDEKVLEGIRPPVEDSKNYPLRYAGLFKTCWAKDPDDRPTASRVVDILESMSP